MNYEALKKIFKQDDRAMSSLFFQASDEFEPLSLSLSLCKNHFTWEILLVALLYYLTLQSVKIESAKKQVWLKMLKIA